jgi:chemotaxis protein MotB
MNTEDEQKNQDCPPVGLPAYIGTFADLMALLMVFFVLLLSFSEMDALKYKMVVKSLDNAFGVQREVAANEIPKGTSIIAQEFSPGEPRPTPLKEVRQDTQDETKEFQRLLVEQGKAEKEQERIIQQESKKITIALASEISEGLVDVETQDDRIVIRIREKAAFPSGDAHLNVGFLPIMKKIHDALIDIEGKVVVAGHTDDVPINTTHYESNWELSTSRATAVVRELLKIGRFSAEKFTAEGHAETEPLVPNDSVKNRARNRRVELIVLPLIPVAGDKK